MQCTAVPLSLQIGGWRQAGCVGKGGIREHMLCTLVWFFSPPQLTVGGCERGFAEYSKGESHTETFKGGGTRMYMTHTQYLSFLRVKPPIHHRPAQDNSQAEVTSSHPLSPVLTLEKVCKGVRVGLGLRSVHSYSPCQAVGHNSPMEGSRLENCPGGKASGGAG